MNHKLEMPIFNEWLVFMQRDAEQAEDLFARLQAEISQKEGVNVPTAALMGL